MDGPPIFSRPDWMMLGVPQIGGMVAVLVSGRIVTAELSVNYPQRRGEDLAGWPSWRIPEPDPLRCEMSAVLDRFAVITGPDYGAALGRVTRQG